MKDKYVYTLCITCIKIYSVASYYRCTTTSSEDLWIILFQNVAATRVKQASWTEIRSSIALSHPCKIWIRIIMEG